MCGIAGIFGQNWDRNQLESMVAVQHHRGPDASGIYIDPQGKAGLGHNRLSIIDLSESGRQPMSDSTNRFHVIFNGEIYNYIELRRELRSEYEFRTNTDTEVLLAAYQKWGKSCLDRLIGMFAFAIWDERDRSLFAARDRLGVKPLYYHQRKDGTLFLSSEVKALRAGGLDTRPDPITWASYFAYGLSDQSERTFWEGVKALRPGHCFTWRDGRMNLSCWYDLADRVAPEFDSRPLEVVQEEYLALLTESVRLRFRADVPVGINLSGGLDSSTLLGLVQSVQGAESEVKAFTFITGDAQYDELPWVSEMLARTRHPSVVCRLDPDEVPALAESVQWHEEEPFGGLPTLAYSRLFERARAEGVIVLLDGQGLDEQWAGYDYYNSSPNGGSAIKVQGAKDKPVKPECLIAEFRALAEPFDLTARFSDTLRSLQYRDARFTKIPRALRFNDRISMRASTELREPFLDHRLFELAMRQPAERKIVNGTRKWMLRQIGRQLLPDGVIEAPKRALQTPQREWLRGPLKEWAGDLIDRALAAYGGAWLDTDAVVAKWQSYCDGVGDNSFYIWQWLSLGLTAKSEATEAMAAHE
jgi:asparagine synthase (glutamine-hydrolysing)